MKALEAGVSKEKFLTYHHFHVGLPFGVLLDYFWCSCSLASPVSFIISFCFLYFVVGSTYYFIYRHLIYLSRVVTFLYLSRAGGILWPCSPLWV